MVVPELSVATEFVSWDIVCLTGQTVSRCVAAKE